MEDDARLDRETPAADPSVVGHPKGTLLIVLLYGVLFASVWLGLYLFVFLPRGTPHP